MSVGETLNAPVASLFVSHGTAMLIVMRLHIVADSRGQKSSLNFQVTF